MDIEELLHIGADKISINTNAYKDMNLITESANKFGSQCIVVSMDAKKVGQNYEVYINRGSESINISPVDWAIEVENRGAGEILLNSIDYDGSRKGYDLELMKMVSDVVQIPVIAFGGVFQWQHMAEALEVGMWGNMCSADDGSVPRVMGALCRCVGTSAKVETGTVARRMPVTERLRLDSS